MKHCVVFWSTTRKQRSVSALFIHRSTLLYRLDKIKAFLDSDLTDRNEILYLLLSFHLMDMEEENRNARS